jgi:hypothetical protein
MQRHSGERGLGGGGREDVEKSSELCMKCDLAFIAGHDILRRVFPPFFSCDSVLSGSES